MSEQECSDVIGNVYLGGIIYVERAYGELYSSVILSESVFTA